MLHRRLSIFFALALLLFSWAQLEHDSDVDAHGDGGSCAFCLFTDALDHGATPVAVAPLLQIVAHAAPLLPQAAPVLPQPFRHTLGQRGPPALS